MSTTIICSGTIDVSGSVPACSSGWLSIETSLGFDISQLDPTSLLSAFVAGATICFVPLSIAWACTFLLGFIGGRHG